MTIYNKSWEAVIGLEIHVQLATNSKLFSGASTHFGALPNTQACNIDLAMPGVLPVLNEEVLRMAIKLGKALNAEINSPTSFARKNYFYPDSPKGYQISQMDKPIVEDGYLDIETDKGGKRIGNAGGQPETVEAALRILLLPRPASLFIIAICKQQNS